MMSDARFGLPLSLAEALRADAAPDAALLADMLAEGELTQPPPRSPPKRRRGLMAMAGLAGFALASGLSMEAYAAAPILNTAFTAPISAPGLEGRWVMAPGQSSFRESVTGPAPDRAVVLISRSDENRLTYELVESREGAEVARGVYDVSFDGAASTSSVGGAVMPVQGERGADGEVLITSPSIGGERALIRVRQTGPNTARLEHEVETAHGPVALEEIALVRADRTASR